MFGHVLIHSFDKTHVLVVTLIGLLLLNILSFNFVEQISVMLARFRRSYVKRTAVVLTSHTSYTAFLLDECCVVQSGYGPFLQLFVPDDSVFV